VASQEMILRASAPNSSEMNSAYQVLSGRRTTEVISLLFSCLFMMDSVYARAV
jgi:hypothetical protein